MIKHLIAYTVLVLFGIACVKVNMDLRAENQLKQLEIESLIETQMSIIKGYEEDITIREEQLKNRKTVIKEIVKVERNNECLKTVIDNDIIDKLRNKN